MALGFKTHPSKVISFVYEDQASNQRAIGEIVNAYKQRFQQESVLQVKNQNVAIGFGQGEDLIVNDPTSELIQVDPYFDRDAGIKGRGGDRQFNRFLRNEITPRFPDGLTVYDAKGQFLDSSNQLIREPSKVISLILEDTQTNEGSINQIIDAYKQRFQQESVLTVVDETLGVAFDVSNSVQLNSSGQSNFDQSNTFSQDKLFQFTLPTESLI